MQQLKKITHRRFGMCFVYFKYHYISYLSKIRCNAVILLNLKNKRLPRFARNDKPNIYATLLSLRGALATWQSDLKGRCEGKARGNLLFWTLLITYIS